MKWILVQSVLIICTTVPCTIYALSFGVCKVRKGFRMDKCHTQCDFKVKSPSLCTIKTAKHMSCVWLEGDIQILIEDCCNNFYKKNGLCVECPIGHSSKGNQCTRCLDGQYGKKCAEICKCSSTERCDNVRGCIYVNDNERSTIYMTIPVEEEDSISYSITLREIILFVVITSFGFLIVGGLVYMCWKRQSRILITQNQQNEMMAKNSENDRQIQLTEEGSESVYTMIDESAMSKTLEPSTLRMQNSYLDVTYSPNTPIDIKDNEDIINLTRSSYQLQQVNNTYLRWQRGSLEESVFSCQGVLQSAYSDGYLKPRSFEHHNGINQMVQKQGNLFSNKVAREGYNGHTYDEPAYDGISRQANYDVLFKDRSTSRNEIVLAQYLNGTEKLENNIRHPKHSTYSSKRKTI